MELYSVDGRQVDLRPLRHGVAGYDAYGGHLYLTTDGGRLVAYDGFILPVAQTTLGNVL